MWRGEKKRPKNRRKRKEEKGSFTNDDFEAKKNIYYIQSMRSKNITYLSQTRSTKRNLFIIWDQF